jgi:aspartyl-tRNA(Asn)/glutamyl-tRNA(Gln) amidotransferase subunit C
MLKFTDDHEWLRTDEGPPIPLALPKESFAPAMRDGFFIVPRLATHEGAGE